MADFNYLVNWYVKQRTGTPVPTVSERKVRLIADAHAYYQTLGLPLNTANAEMRAYLDKLWADSLAPAPTIPTYRSHTRTAFVDRGVTTFDRPAGTVNGDLVLAICVARAAPTPADIFPPTGFSQPLFLAIPADGGLFTNVYVWSRIANNDPPTYLTSHTMARTMVYCAAIQATHQTTPMSPLPSSQIRAANPPGTSIAPGVTTLIANSLVVFFSVATDPYTGSAVPPTGTTPTFTERTDIGPLYVADGRMVTAGATGNKSHTNPNVTGTQWGAGLISVRGV